MNWREILGQKFANLHLVGRKVYFKSPFEFEICSSVQVPSAKENDEDSLECKVMLEVNVGAIAEIVRYPDWNSRGLWVVRLDEDFRTLPIKGASWTEGEDDFHFTGYVRRLVKRYNLELPKTVMKLQKNRILQVPSETLDFLPAKAE